MWVTAWQTEIILMRLGIDNTKALWEVDATDFQRVFDVNVLDSSSPYTNQGIFHDDSI